MLITHSDGNYFIFHKVDQLHLTHRSALIDVAYLRPRDSHLLPVCSERAARSMGCMPFAFQLAFRTIFACPPPIWLFIRFVLPLLLVPTRSGCNHRFFVAAFLAFPFSSSLADRPIDTQQLDEFESGGLLFYILG